MLVNGKIVTNLERTRHDTGHADPRMLGAMRFFLTPPTYIAVGDICKLRDGRTVTVTDIERFDIPGRLVEVEGDDGRRWAVPIDLLEAETLEFTDVSVNVTYKDPRPDA